MRWKDKETVLVLLLDTKSRLIKPVEISSGTLNESIAHPRDILHDFDKKYAAAKARHEQILKGLNLSLIHI